MHNDDAQFSALMDRLGERLKLASHQVRGRRIVGPADIEGHKGPDGKYYLVDLARMFPVRAPPVRVSVESRRACVVSVES